jgi:EpsI family protein
MFIQEPRKLPFYIKDGMLSLFRGTWTVPAVVVAAFVFVYGAVLTTLVKQWLSNDTYAHGFLIPCISLYLVWTRRKQLRLLIPHTNYGLGSALLALGMAMLFLGNMGNILILQTLSLPITIAGMVALLLGTEFLGILWLPIAYLLFMIPIWDVLTDPLRPYYQKMSAYMGAFLVSLAGIPVYREGVLIDLPNITLKVARECSGVQYLIAIIAIGIPLSYMAVRSWIRRIAIIALGIVIATLFNGVRIGLIGIMSYYGISSVLHGPGHVLQALSVSMAGYAALFAGAWLLSDKAAPASSASSPTGENHIAREKKAGSHSFTFPLIVLVTAFAVTGAILLTTKPVAIPPARDLDSFPYQIDEWRGTDVKPVVPGLMKLGADRELSRRYENSTGDIIYLFVGYFDAQGPTKKLASYLTDEFHKAATKIRLGVNAASATRKPIEVNRVVMTDNDQAIQLLFWYDIQGRIIADRYRVSLATAMNRIQHRHTNGALVMIACKPEFDSDKKERARAVPTFTDRLLPLLNDYLH